MVTPTADAHVVEQVRLLGVIPRHALRLDAEIAGLGVVRSWHYFRPVGGQPHWHRDLYWADAERKLAAPVKYLEPGEVVDIGAVANGRYLALTDRRLLVVGMSRFDGHPTNLVSSWMRGDVSFEKTQRFRTMTKLHLRIVGQGEVEFVFRSNSRRQAPLIGEALGN